MHVCVLGAGIVGLSAAWELLREGHAVTVVDRAWPGAGASGGNGAQLSYAYVQPLADPGLWRQLPKLLLAADSPLKLRPQWDVDQWRWAAAFLAACRGSASRRATANLLSLAAQSRAAFEAWRAQEQPDCDFSASGKLVIYRDATSFAAARRQLALQQALGTRQEAVTAPECAAIEPALEEAAAGLAGGIHTPGECAADCQKVCDALLRGIERRGARVLLGTGANAWKLRNGRAVALATSAGEIEADAFVVSLGTGSTHLARQLGLYLPVYPLKGYSITLAANDAAPRVSVTDAARKVVFARIGNRLRVAGMAELVGEDRHIPSDRIERLRAATSALFPQAATSADCEPWAGLRPATPTGIPIVGALPRGPSNVLFNTGHGALGFTLAFGSARRLAAQLRAAPWTSRSPARPASCNA
jgi:D-amino-acid dehydrogenase